MNTIKRLVGLYVGVNIVTIIVIFALQSNSQLVNDTVWIRCSIMAATSLLLLIFAFRLKDGAYRAFLRVRIITALLFVSVIVLLFIPGLLPMWVKVEQGICGILLLTIFLVVNKKARRTISAQTL